jgi:hypothetical protein
MLRRGGAGCYIYSIANIVNNNVFIFVKHEAQLNRKAASKIEMNGEKTHERIEVTQHEGGTDQTFSKAHPKYISLEGSR